MKLRVAEDWLHSCAGCEIAILNTGEQFLALLTDLDVVHMPVLMDHKYFGQCGEKNELSLPEADVGIVSGSLAHEEHLQIVKEMRRKCKVLIALGTCATHGGIPALMNMWGNEKGMETVFLTSTTDHCETPAEGLPKWLDRVYAVDEKVAVDFHLPGCPPNPERIASILQALVHGQELKHKVRSVCDSCPAQRKGKGDVWEVRRFLVNADYEPETPLAEMRCLLEQGFLCMGPVTADGCAQNGAPGCIEARVPCRGCFGPVRRDGNQLLDMMNALSSNLVDYKSVIDRRSLLRFSGSHGLLRPIRPKG